MSDAQSQTCLEEHQIRQTLSTTLWQKNGEKRTVFDVSRLERAGMGQKKKRRKNECYCNGIVNKAVRSSYRATLLILGVTES